jgi:hypothetical protein
MRRGASVHFRNGDAVVVNRDGLSVFDNRHRQHDYAAVLCAFDLVELEHVPPELTR